MFMKSFEQNAVGYPSSLLKCVIHRIIEIFELSRIFYDGSQLFISSHKRYSLFYFLPGAKFSGEGIRLHMNKLLIIISFIRVIETVYI